MWHGTRGDMACVGPARGDGRPSAAREGTPGHCCTVLCVGGREASPCQGTAAWRTEHPPLGTRSQGHPGSHQWGTRLLRGSCGSAACSRSCALDESALSDPAPGTCPPFVSPWGAESRSSRSGGAGLAPASCLTLLSSGAGLGATVCSGRLSAQAGRVLGCPLLLRGLPAYWGRTGRPGHCRALLLTRLRHAPWGGGRVTSASGSTGHPAEPARLPTQTSCLCG